MRVFVVAIVIFFLFLYSFLIEPNLLTVKEYNIEYPLLKGLKVVFVGDFHIKPSQVKRLDKIISKINKQQPDLVLLAGDFVAGHEKDSTLPIEQIARALGTIKVQHGIYSVLGNHDVWLDPELVTKELEKNGIKVLNNSNFEVKYNHTSLYIAGVEDLTTSQPDIIKALKKTNPPIILLSHSPDIFPSVPNDIFLTLAGHTHGGQVRFPFIGSLIVPSDYGNEFSYGLIEKNGKKMIVTKGIGTSILPIRFCCLPEIVVINF